MNIGVIGDKSISSGLNESRISWMKNDDEITIIDFTHSSCFESSFDWSEGILSPKLRESKSSKKTIKRWKFNSHNRNDVRLVSVDLSDSNEVSEEVVNNVHVPVTKLDITMKERVNIINQKEKCLDDISLERKFKYNKYQIPQITNERKRVKRIIKDSIGSNWNHKESLEEIIISNFDQSPSDSGPKKSKPKATKICMLSGDDLKERISITENISKEINIDQKLNNNSSKELQVVRQRVYSQTDKLVKTQEKKEFSKVSYIPLSGFQSPTNRPIISSVEEHEVESDKNYHNPRTRNQTITVLSTNYNTCETRAKWDSQMRYSKLQEMSPICNIRPISEIDEMSKFCFQKLYQN